MTLISNMRMSKYDVLLEVWAYWVIKKGVVSPRDVKDWAKKAILRLERTKVL